MHMLPDWSTTKTTFTGKPAGSGVLVHTVPVRLSWLSVFWAAWEGGSSWTSEHAPAKKQTASQRLAVRTGFAVVRLIEMLPY
jgi:hypothetical protein